MIDTDKLAEVLAAATKGPWQVHGSHFYGPDPDRVLIGQMWSGGPFDANLTLITMARDLADGNIRLRAEVAQLVAANTRLMGLVEGASDAVSILASLAENPDGAWSDLAFDIQGVRITNGDIRRARKWREEVK